MNFIDYLVKKNFLTEEQKKRFESEIKKTGSCLEELILNEKIIEEKELFKAKSQFFKVRLKEILEKEISSNILSIIPKESVEFYKMIPLAIDKEKKILDVGMIFPENPQAQEALKFLTRQQKFSFNVFLITFSDFKKCLENYQTVGKEVESALERLKEELKAESKKETSQKETLSRLVEEAPIIKMVGVILRQAFEGGASDIHIEPTAAKLKIRYRLNGLLYSSLFLPLNVHSAVMARIKILSGLKIDETRVPQDGRFSTKFGEKKIDLRVSTFPTAFGEKVAIRILDPEAGTKTLDDLGFQGRNLDIIQGALKKTYGFILITGPTGCGKTTTLYALLKILNKDEVNIVTLEDPIEYCIEGINQSQVKPQIDYTFARGLRQILRQDPDIIMVGEIRDEETASLAIHAALTGHLVLSTLHTSNAASVVPRLVDMGIKPFLIPPTLSLVISQRLIRTLCPLCKEKIKASGQYEDYILNTIKGFPVEIVKKLNIKSPIYVYRAKGCEKCNFKGYAGRIGISEAMKMTDVLGKIIIKNSAESEILEEARKQGMMTIAEDGILKVLQGFTSMEEVMREVEEV
jgi:type IV pilus assembly protein PilB